MSASSVPATGAPTIPARITHRLAECGLRLASAPVEFPISMLLAAGEPTRLTDLRSECLRTARRGNVQRRLAFVFEFGGLLAAWWGVALPALGVLTLIGSAVATGGAILAVVTVDSAASIANRTASNYRAWQAGLREWLRCTLELEPYTRGQTKLSSQRHDQILTRRRGSARLPARSADALYPEFRTIATLSGEELNARRLALVRQLRADLVVLRTAARHGELAYERLARWRSWSIYGLLVTLVVALVASANLGLTSQMVATVVSIIVLVTRSAQSRSPRVAERPGDEVRLSADRIAELEQSLANIATCDVSPLANGWVLISRRFRVAAESGEGP